MGKRRLLLITLALLILFFIFLMIKYVIEKNSSQIYLIGDETLVHEVNTEYRDPGFRALSHGKKLDEYVKTKTNVDTSTVGEYTVEYILDMDFLFLNKSVKRTVIVKDYSLPSISVDAKDEIIVPLNSNFNVPKYSAYDEYDGDITTKVVVTNEVNTKAVGDYKIKYSVKDSTGNSDYKEVVVHVLEKNPHIDISIEKQTLTYYEYGVEVLSSDVVTGIYNNTPRGNFKVLSKYKNTFLKGKTYTSFVSYWIGFHGTEYGIHDASWRVKFGGDIYKYNGSHGCVNMPIDKVKKLYDYVEIGMQDL